MAVWQATNILTGAIELPKYIQIGVFDQMWSVALTTALANGDTILGPTLEAGLFLSSVKIAVADLDSGGGILFEVGYAGSPAAFITPTTIGQTGGIVSLNVPSGLGFTSAVNTQIVVTITHAATVPVAGTMVIELSATASP